MAEPARPNRWSRPTAEAAVVLTALLLAFAAGVAGFVVGRETADAEPAAAETTTAAETTAETETVEPETATTETTETETGTTETGTETETEGGEDADGAAVFSQACATCHTFEPAGSTATIGPPLDGIDLSKEEIATQVRNGGGGMPAFEGQLSDAEIDAVADYVESG